MSKDGNIQMLENDKWNGGGERLSQPYWKLSLHMDRYSRRIWYHLLPPVQWACGTSFSTSALHSEPSCAGAGERQGCLTDSPSTPVHTHQWASGDSRLQVCTDFWGGKHLKGHLVPPLPDAHPLSLPRGGLACASAPQAKACYMFPSGISRGAQRITYRILDKGTS